MRSRRDERDEARSAVASYDSYAEAERAVDRLYDRNFPVERVRIVGEGMRSVGRSTAGAGYPRAASRGVSLGATAGLFVGLLLGLADPLGPGPWLAFYGLFLGAIVGAASGLVGHAFFGGRRNSSAKRLEASRYDVMVEEALAPSALRRLSQGS